MSVGREARLEDAKIAVKDIDWFIFGVTRNLQDVEISSFYVGNGKGQELAILRPVAQVHEHSEIVEQQFLWASVSGLCIDSLLPRPHGDISQPLAVRRPDGCVNELRPGTRSEPFFRAGGYIHDEEVLALVVQVLLHRRHAFAVRRQNRAIVERALADLARRRSITVQKGKDGGLVLELLSVPLGPGFGHVFGLSFGAQALADNLAGVLGKTEGGSSQDDRNVHRDLHRKPQLSASQFASTVLRACRDDFPVGQFEGTDEPGARLVARAAEFHSYRLPDAVLEIRLADIADTEEAG